MQLTKHHVGSMLFPIGEPAFITVPACGTDGAFEAEIVSVSARKVTGADVVEFQAAWLGPGERLNIGAAGISQIEEPFEPANGTAGTVKGCSDMPNSLELAVVLPEAVTHSVVVEDIEVTYIVGAREYKAVADVTYGVCASAPEEPADEPEDCQAPGNDG